MYNDCPKCGFSTTLEQFVTCPKCGIVVDKFKKTEEKKAIEKQKNGSTELILNRYLGRDIGINYDHHSKHKKAKITAVGQDCFSVNIATQGINYHFPFIHILSMCEADNGNIDTGILGVEAPLIVSIYHQVVYKGAVGLSMGIPFE